MRSTHRSPARLLWAPVAAATFALVWIVPVPPWTRLDDPNHWGVLGYVATLPMLVRAAGVDCRRFPRTLLTIFLAAMPLVFVADVLRLGGTPAWLAIEVGGLALFGTLAWLGFRRSAAWLAIGIALHGLWDAWHLGTVTPFVPDWYATGCAVVDLPLAGWAAGVWLLDPRRSRGRAATRPESQEEL